MANRDSKAEVALEQFRELILAADRLIERTMSKEIDAAQLQSAFDVIQDTASACRAFMAMRPKATSSDEHYLLLYGVYQALSMQQDAVDTLRSIAGLSSRTTARLREIRRVRVLVAGHPTRVVDYHPAVASHLVMVHINAEFPTLLVRHGDGGSSSEALRPLQDIADQDGELASLLVEATEHLRSLSADHTGRFLETPLGCSAVALLHKVDEVSRVISGGVEGEKSSLKGMVSECRAGLGYFVDLVGHRRELRARRATLQPVIDMARHCLARLEMISAQDQASKEVVADARIYSMHLQETASVLLEFADTIDVEYGSVRVERSSCTKSSPRRSLTGSSPLATVEMFVSMLPNALHKPVGTREALSECYVNGALDALDSICMSTAEFDIHDRPDVTDAIATARHCLKQLGAFVCLGLSEPAVRLDADVYSSALTKEVAALAGIMACKDVKGATDSQSVGET